MPQNTRKVVNKSSHDIHCVYTDEETGVIERFDLPAGETVILSVALANYVERTYLNLDVEKP